VEKASEILPCVEADTEVVAIDEGQFFDASIVGVADELANRGLRVIVAGLDQDYRGRPFEPMPELLAVAEYITKTLAICMVCGAPANRTYRKLKRGGRVVVGGTDLYEARCRRCFALGPRVHSPAPPLPAPGGSDERSHARPRARRRRTRGTARRLR